MTLQQILKEIEIIKGLVCDTTKVDLSYEGVSDIELENYTKDKHVMLHKPSTELPYFWFVIWDGNVSVTIRGAVKEVTINY